MRVWEEYESRVFRDGATRLGLSDEKIKEVELAFSDDEAPRPCVVPTCERIPSGSGVPIGTPEDKLQELVEGFSDLELEESWLKKQTPQIHVDIDAFSMGVFPVTKLEKALFKLDNADGQYDREFIRYSLDVSTLFHPADLTDLDLADRYIEWLSKKSGQKYRLPTEFEWEYAASGGDGRKYPWGQEWRQRAANTAELGLHTTLPVFCQLYDKAENGFPIVGMAGNVEEITSSEHKPYVEGAEDDVDGFAEFDPSHRIVRGGSYTKWRDLASCQRRHSIWVGSAFGMRLVTT